MKKVVLFIAGALVYYFTTVLVLHILVTLFNDSFENVWLSAIPTTIMSGILTLIWSLWVKRKKK